MSFLGLMKNKVMERSLNILVLEDSPDDFELIVRTLKKGGLFFQSLCVDSKDEYNNALKSFKPDIILSDHALPQFNSLEALKLCRRKGLEVPFILVTGTVSEEFAVSTLKQGADDYILKSNLARLPSAIISALKKKEMEVSRHLAEQDLRQQNVELVKINKELDSFVYSVSHDIRSPLMSVLGLVNLLQTEGDTIDNKEQLFDMMRTSIHKLDDTLIEIIDYSKNARSEVVPSAVDFNSVIHDSFNHLKFMPGCSEIKKEIEIKDGVIFYSDVYRLKVIFNNLISNSVKYRDKRKESFVKVEIRLTEESAIILFEDNGIGIEQQLLDKIFNMFFRATDQCEGSGLGLYIVKEAIEKMKGTIGVESVLGYGTKFRIELPNLKFANS
jgi:signal transduction histidine kinase